MDRLENLNVIIRGLMAERLRVDASAGIAHVSYKIPSSLKEKQRMMRALMNVWSSENIQACLEGRVATSEDEVNVWEPKDMDAEFLAAQDAELQQQTVDKGVVEIAERGLTLWQGDITRLKVDAIVNAANAQGLGCWAPLHNCIDNCIHSAAGIQLRQECFDQLRGRLLTTGEAIITRGYNLPAQHVIHTVGPIIDTDIPTREQEAQLAQCYRSCLDLAEQAGLQSIAFCCISTGVFHFPNERAAEIAIRTVRSYPTESVKTIIFNVFLDKDYDIYQRLLAAD